MKPCYVRLSHSYVEYIRRFVLPEKDPLKLSVQDDTFKHRTSERFKVIMRGDGLSDKPLYVELPDGIRQWIEPHHVTVIEGSLRTVPKRGRIHMGRGSISGRIAHAIKSGRAFRGR